MTGLHETVVRFTEHFIILPKVRNTHRKGSLWRSWLPWANQQCRLLCKKEAQYKINVVLCNRLWINWITFVCRTDKVMKQDREIRDMKQKIAEVMAVSPGISYMAPRPPVPQYLTKLLTSERYMLTPRALMYQCLKKWRMSWPFSDPQTSLADPLSPTPRWLSDFTTEPNDATKSSSSSSEWNQNNPPRVECLLPHWWC